MQNSAYRADLTAIGRAVLRRPEKRSEKLVGGIDQVDAGHDAFYARRLNRTAAYLWILPGGPMELAKRIEDDRGAELELRVEYGNTKRHYLGGRPISNGTEVELRLSGGHWMRGIYEWSGLDSRWPGLRVRLDVARDPENGRPVYAVMAMPPQALLRWPAERVEPQGRPRRPGQGPP
jgi:hypothetical protein